MRSSDDSMNGAEERPTFHFRGGFLRADVFYLLRDNKITKTDLLLLFMVDALVKTRGEGCWASNAYLAEQIGATPTYVSDSIKKLSGDDLKLMIVSHKNTRRYLETDWSRSTKEKEYMDEQLRKNPKPPSDFSEGRFRKNPKHREEESREKKRTTCSSAEAASNGVKRRTLVSSRRSREEQVKEEQSISSTPYTPRGLANLLYQGLLKARKLMRQVNLSNWTKEIDELVAELMRRDDISSDSALEKIHEALTWWLPTIGAEYHIKIRSAESFRKRFTDVEDAIERERLKKGHKRRSEGEDSNRLREDQIW